MPIIKFRSRLRELRETRGLSRMDIVRHANISYSTVHRWETSDMDRVDATTVKLLCDFLGCTQDELVSMVLVDDVPAADN